MLSLGPWIVGLIGALAHGEYRGMVAAFTGPVDLNIQLLATTVAWWTASVG